MSRLKPSTAWSWIVENKRGKFSARDRLHAFLQITRPSLAMMRRLLASPRTPRKLRMAAAEKYSTAMARKELVSNARQKKIGTDRQRPVEHVRGSGARPSGGDYLWRF